MKNEPAMTHPSPEELEALVRRQGPEPVRLRHLDHVMTCESCRRDFELLRAIDAAEPVTRRIPAWLPIAAAVVLAVGAGGVWWTQRVEPADVTRDAGAGGLELLSPADSVAPAEAPYRFVWRAAAGASGYHFELLTEEGRLVHEVTGPDTTTTLPATVPVEPGRYRWWVTAQRPAGDLPSAARLLVIR